MNQSLIVAELGSCTLWTETMVEHDSLYGLPASVDLIFVTKALSQSKMSRYKKCRQYKYFTQTMQVTTV